MSDITEADRDAIQSAIQNAINDESVKPLTKKVRDLADDIVESVEWSIKDYLASNLAYHVKEMAGRAVQAMLDGNENEMVRWLNGDSSYTGRSPGAMGDKPVHDQHPVIHGKLFERGAVAIRRRLVEAHRDIIADQRMLDLEDQVRSLVEQNNIMRRERDDALERLRAYV